MAKERQKKIYVRERAKGATTRVAAAKAGISRPTGQKVERDPAFRSEMHKALEKVGATTEKIASTVLESLDATKVISANVVNKSGEGMADAHGTTKDFIDVPDYAVRCKAAELAGKFRGDFVERSEMELKGAVTIRIRSNVKG